MDKYYVVVLAEDILDGAPSRGNGTQGMAIDIHRSVTDQLDDPIWEFIDDRTI